MIDYFRIFTSHKANLVISISMKIIYFIDLYKVEKIVPKGV